MLVLFDIGSTLIEGPPVGPGKRLVQALSLKSEFLESINDFLFRTPLEDAGSLAEFLVQRCGADANLSIEVSKRLWDAQLDESYALPGAERLIDELSAAGVRRSYISNIWSPFYSGFERFFSDEARNCKCFLSFELGISKPDIGFYEHALETLNVSPSDVIMVGDTYSNDMAPAIELGMGSVWVLHRPSKEKEELLEVINGRLPRPSLTVGSVGDLTYPLLREIYDKTNSV